MNDAYSLGPDFAWLLDRTDTGELKRILREDLETEEPVADRREDPVTAILEAVIQREADDPSVPHLDLDAGWAELRKTLCPGESAAPGEQTA